MCACQLVLAGAALAQATLATKWMRLSVNQRGELESITDLIHNREYMPKGKAAPFISVHSERGMEAPSRMEYLRESSVMRFEFRTHRLSVDVRVAKNPEYLAFTVVRVDPDFIIDMLQWGPFPTGITKTIGEIVGVVRDDEYAIGIQSLNAKTLGGTRLNDEGIEPSRGRAAERTDFGCVLQAYAIERRQPRMIDVWQGNFPRMTVPSLRSEGVVNTRIALFGCKESDVLNVIERIETSEDLPHPKINGIWEKRSAERGRSYLIADFSESTIDSLLDFAQRAGLAALYHMNAFESWGHYDFSKKYFPHGLEGVRRCAAKAKARGIRLGAHTLTNFINTDDPYVTPFPDPRLAVTGSSTLTDAIDATTNVIPVASPEYFNNEKANWLHTVRIGTELVTYKSVSSAAPYRLLDCERGAFGTKAASHEKNSVVAKLLDHPYKVFFPSFEMQHEIAMTLAKRFNESGLSQMDFDGREGCWASGQGDYAQEEFSRIFYASLDSHVVNGTSTSSHFFWHINSYCNWGEPWSGGFREAMQQYRIENQALFERNYMPNMLGWYKLTETTTLEEMEWMLARAAGYNAGFAIATSLEALKKNPDVGTLLHAIREWENARRAGAFTPEQCERLKNTKYEFHLEARGDNRWRLYPYHNAELKTGISSEPRTLEVENSDDDQPLQFRVTVASDAAGLRDLKLTLGNEATIAIPVELRAGESLVCDGTKRVRIYTDKGEYRTAIVLKDDLPEFETGKHRLTVSTSSIDGTNCSVLLMVRTRGEAEDAGR